MLPHGTLRVLDAIPDRVPPSLGLLNEGVLDPTFTMYDLPDTAEILRCCLGRTLLSYNGQPTAKGGSVLRPDLATDLPEVAPDGLTWTFRLRAGLHYAPPLQDTEIVASDVIRALSRTARLSLKPPPYLSVIQGYDDYARGRTTTISGLQAPDHHTLVVRLTQPAGDLGYRLSVYSTAPIAPLPGHPNAPFGVATGHDDGDTGFIVSSGPYMLEGAGAVDFRQPADRQKPASGFVDRQTLTLVRNPSWSAARDGLRAAYADRIVIDFRTPHRQVAAQIDAGQADIALDVGPPPQVSPDEVHAYQTDPARGRVEITARDSLRYLSMNLAVPPFDDVHVRRAVAYAIDRQAAQTAFGGPISATVTGHLALDSLEDDALLSFDPYRSDSSESRRAMARREMAQSRYDPGHTGLCSAAVCRGIVALNLSDHPAALGTGIAGNLAEIGILVNLQGAHFQEFFTKVGDPASRTPMAIGWAWGKDYPNGSDWFTTLFSRRGFGDAFNFSLIGATPDQLRAWGYGVSSVPSVDDRIDQCLPLVGGAQTGCWSTLDQYMMDKVLPVVPLFTETYIEVVPSRVTAYSFDQAFNMPALDRIRVTR